MGSLKLRGRIWWVRYNRNGRRFEESSNSEHQQDAVRLLTEREAEAPSAGIVSGRVQRHPVSRRLGQRLNLFTIGNSQIAPCPAVLPVRERGYVYFICDAAMRFVKIGYTTNMSARWKSIQAHNPEPLCLLMVLNGDASVEAWWHHQWRHARSQGEWFQLSAEVLSEIDGFVARPSVVYHHLGGEPVTRTRHSDSTSSGARKSVKATEHDAPAGRPAKSGCLDINKIIEAINTQERYERLLDEYVREQRGGQ